MRRQAPRRAGAAVLVASLAALLAAPAVAAPAGSVEPGARNEAALRAALARRFAPQLRFNAWSAHLEPIYNNRNEDFLPGSVDTFLRALDTGRYRVVARLSDRARAAIVEEVRGTRGRIEGDHIVGYPERLAGAAPGEAPTYVHVYRAGRDAEGAERWFCEYWQWYPYDHACAHVLGRRGCVGSHRGDWEHQSFELRLPAGGRAESARLVRGLFYGHGWAFWVPAEELERVNERGEETDDGDHPVVYVSVGKHASYPHAGELRSYVARRWLVEHDDVFHGNGVWIDTWRGPLVDIAPAAVRADPSPFATDAWRSLIERSTGRGAPHWLAFRGRWGPEGQGLLGLDPVRSPTGPWAKSNFGDAGRSAVPFARWRARFGERLRLDRERPGGRLPRRSPAPVPRPAGGG